jgi:two-component system sensor kinase FixL
MQLFKRAIIIIQFSILLCSTATALEYQTDSGNVHIHTGNMIYELSGKWYFRAHDSLEYREKSIDLKNWELIHSNVTWTHFHEFSDYRGNAWYRINILLDHKITDLALLLPFHYRGAQFYLNGKIIHETRSFNDKGETPPVVGKPDLMVFPGNILEKGVNILAIRTGWLDNNGGFWGSILIGPYKEIHKRWIQYILWYSSLAAINLFLTLYFLLLFWNRGGERYYLYFSGLAFSLGIWILGYKGLVLWILDYQWAYILFTYIGAILAPFMTINFLHFFLDQSRTWITRLFNIFFPLLAVLLLFELLLTGRINFFQRFLYEPFILSNILVIIYGTVVCILGVKNGKPYAKRILMATLVLALSFVFSMFYFLGVFSVEPLLLEGFFAMTVIFASVLASRFARVHTDLESAHGNLLEINRLKDDTMDKLSIYKHIVSSSGDQMSFINGDYIIIAANKALLKAIKKEEHQVVGQSIETIYGKKEFENSLRDYCDRCLSGEELQFEEWCDYFDDGLKYIVNTMYPHIDENGEIVGITLNSRDITENVKLEKSIVDIGQEERRQIGIELHDGLSHDLLMIAIKSRLLAESLKDTSVSDASMAYEIERHINRAIEDTRNLARGISPVTLDRGSLIMLFDKMKEDVENKCEISFELEVDKSIEFEDIMIPTHLYYITQEAVKNAVRHSRAKHIRIRFFSDDKHIHLVVEDDGVGITRKVIKEKGIGLDIMKYRARMLGGTLDVHSVKKSGTKVICRI